MNRVATKHIALAFGLAASLVALTAAPGATQNYPTKSIRIVVPYPAGGPTDLVGRTLADALTKALKTSVIVENKAGAGGTIGSDSVVKSAPDGYVLLLGLMGPMSIAPKISPNLPYDPVKDLAPIRLVAIMPEVLVARPKLGLKTLSDVVGYGKANPGKLTIASAGNGSLPHLAAELLKRETGIDALHVPYRGAAPAVNDLLGGQVDLMFGDGPVVLPQILGNLLVPIVMATDKRLPVLPDVPTSIEAGFPTIRSENWYGVLAPRGTPRPIIEALDKAIGAAMAEPKIEEMFSKQGVYVVKDGTPETFGTFIAAQLEKWGGLAKDVGARVD
jgi:tripartite-type tricarboxylate transporter receptor subunit TctC